MFCPTGHVHQSRRFQRPLFARLGRDIAFLDEKHILIPASAADSALKPGQNYELMLLVYEFKTSTIASVNKVVAYCFQTALPVRTGLATFRHARISVNTASFSPPTDTDSNSNSNSFPRGYFYADPKDRIITLEVTDNNWMQNMEETAELYVPTRTFLAYMAAHPPLAVSAVRAGTGAGGPIVDVPWEEWGPCGAHLVRTVDQTYIIRRPRSCGMRVLGAPLSKKSVVVADYHPGRVARSAAAAAACVRAPAPAQRPVGTLFSSSSESHVGTGTETGATTRTLMRTRRRCFPPLVRVTKEVPLPAELQDALESPWTMLCEDALLAFEVRLSCEFFSFLLFNSELHTVCPGRLRNQQGVCVYVLMLERRGAPLGMRVSASTITSTIIIEESIIQPPTRRCLDIHRPFSNIDEIRAVCQAFACLRGSVGGWMDGLNLYISNILQHMSQGYGTSVRNHDLYNIFEPID
jgi:hypothetical protein